MNEMEEEQMVPGSNLPVSNKIYNRIEDNYHLSNKKALLINMTQYYKAINTDPFDALPVSFHIKTGRNDPEFERFIHYFNSVTE